MCSSFARKALFSVPNGLVVIQRCGSAGDDTAGAKSTGYQLAFQQSLYEFVLSIAGTRQSHL